MPKREDSFSHFSNDFSDDFFYDLDIDGNHTTSDIECNYPASQRNRDVVNANKNLRYYIIDTEYKLYTGSNPGVYDGNPNHTKLSQPYADLEDNTIDYDELHLSDTIFAYKLDYGANSKNNAVFHEYLDSTVKKIAKLLHWRKFAGIGNETAINSVDRIDRPLFYHRNLNASLLAEWRHKDYVKAPERTLSLTTKYNLVHKSNMPLVAVHVTLQSKRPVILATLEDNHIADSEQNVSKSPASPFFNIIGGKSRTYI